jgi:shikimate dehydrogenase
MSEFRLYAVLGKPVLHSRSPDMFNAAFHQTGASAAYTRLLAPTAADGLRIAAEMEMTGLNVTAPFKEDMLAELDLVDATARRIGAVNTLRREGRRWAGFNTDWIGVVGALRVAGVTVGERTALVLGAGGAGRAAVHGLRTAHAKEVWLANRTVPRAREWAARLDCRWCGLAEAAVKAATADIVVDCLSDESAGRPILAAATGATMLRASYRSGPAMSGGDAKHQRQVDGLEWLLHQALPAYELFETRPAERDVMRGALAQTPGGSRPNVALIGFMGAGKTVVGRALAQRLDRSFVDLDDVIEARAGKSIPQIFVDGGEAEFRRLERDALRDVADGSRQVIACGGGVVAAEENRRRLNGCATSVWLWVPVETVLARAAGSSRPLLAVADPAATARRLMDERRPWYAAVADLVTGTGGEDPESVADRLAAEFTGWRGSGNASAAGGRD